MTNVDMQKTIEFDTVGQTHYKEKQKTSIQNNNRKHHDIRSRNVDNQQKK